MPLERGRFPCRTSYPAVVSTEQACRGAIQFPPCNPIRRRAAAFFAGPSGLFFGPPGLFAGPSGSFFGPPGLFFGPRRLTRGPRPSTPGHSSSSSDPSPSVGGQPLFFVGRSRRRRGRTRSCGVQGRFVAGRWACSAAPCKKMSRHRRLTTVHSVFLPGHSPSLGSHLLSCAVPRPFSAGRSR